MWGKIFQLFFIFHRPMFPSFTVFSCRGLQGGVLTLWVLYLKENVVDQIPVFLSFFLIKMDPNIQTSNNTHTKNPHVATRFHAFERNSNCVKLSEKVIILENANIDFLKIFYFSFIIQNLAQAAIPAVTVTMETARCQKKKCRLLPSISSPWGEDWWLS